MKKLLLTLATALLGATILTTGASAMKAVKLLNHQGQLLDTAGQPVTGAHVLTFRIYTDPTGGTLLHEESKTMVFGSDGLFNVQIGSDVPLDIEDLVDPNETASEALRYLEVEVDSDGPMPRIQLVSTPYSLGAYRVAGDFFSSHNEILMIDSTGDTTATLASKKLFVGGLSWGVEVDSTGRSEMLMQDIGPSGEEARISVHTPEWTNFNDSDPGMTVRKVNSTDSSEAKVSHDGLVISNIRTSGNENHAFIAEGTPIRAKVEVKSDPGMGILKSGFMATDAAGSRLGLSTESTTDAHGEFWFTELQPGEYTVTEHMSVRSTSIDSAYMDLMIDSTDLHLTMANESTTDDHGEFWFMDLQPGAVGGVTQTMMVRSSPTDSAFGQIKIDSSEAGLRMNKSDLVSEISSKTGSAHMSLTDISAADKGEIRAQYNESDLQFIMRHHSTADTALVKMQADDIGPELDLSVEAGGITQSAAKLTHDTYELTKAQLSVQETVFKVDANGTATGATLRVRYPNVAGGATEVFMGDLNADNIPDLSVAGNVGIGSTAPTEKLHVDGNVCVTGNYLTCSDARYKSDVEPIHDAMAQLQQLQGVEFNWRRQEYADRDFPEARQMGFVAQEVQAILPSVVSEGSDGYLAMDYARLTPLLVEALKAQQERIDKLEALLLQLTDDQVTR